MDQRTEEQRTQAIRQDIDATRDSMTDKMEQIESKVRGTVDDLKGSVEHTVENVKQAFDVRQQVSERPWLMLGASVVAGYVLGSMGGSDTSHYRSDDYSYADQPYRYYPEANTAYSGSNYPRDYTSTSYGSAYGQSRGMNMPQQQRSQPGIMSSFMDQFGDELETLKGAALVTVGNMLRDMLHKNLPQFAEEFERARDERMRQQQGDSAFSGSSQSYDPLAERAVGAEREATYQTHTASNYGVNANTGTTASTITSSDPVSNADRNTTY